MLGPGFLGASRSLLSIRIYLRLKTSLLHYLQRRYKTQTDKAQQEPAKD